MATYRLKKKAELRVHEKHPSEESYLVEIYGEGKAELLMCFRIRKETATLDQRAVSFGMPMIHLIQMLCDDGEKKSEQNVSDSSQAEGTKAQTHSSGRTPETMAKRPTSKKRKVRRLSKSS